MRVICLLFPKSTPLKRIAETLHRLTPQISVREGEAIFLEIEQCHRLYSEQTIVLRLQNLMKRMGLSYRLAVAEDPATALAFAKTPGLNKRQLPLRALHEYASPFCEDPVMTREVEKIIWALDRLAVRNLGEFLKLPSRSLSSRFGNLGLKLYRSIKNFQDTPWPRFVPVEKVIERMDWGHELSCDTIDSIFFYVKTLLDRSLLRLFGRGQRLLSFQIKFELEKHSMLKEAEKIWKFDLHLPHGSTRNILSIVRERIGFDLTLKPLEALVNAMELRVVETARSVSSQRDLFFPKREEDQEAWNSLVTRLSVKLGKDKIFCARPVESYLPEKNWAPHMMEKIQTGLSIKIPFPQRPMRLFKEPQHILFDGNTLSMDDRALKVRSLWGPEILSSEWWSDEKADRIYYRVLSETGEKFWVFMQDGKFFLHGVYD